MRKTIALLGVAVASAGCGAPGSVQNAGISDWNVTFHENGAPRQVRIIDGKEKASVRFKVDMATGTAEYSATEVAAFDGQALAADVAKVQANEQGQTLRDVAPGAIEDIVDLVRAYLAK